MIDQSARIRLRPSVAFVPVNEARHEYQFFQGNTRRARSYCLQDVFVRAIGALDGTSSLQEVAGRCGIEARKVVLLMEELHEKCIVELVEVADRISATPWRRVLNFLADYFPSNELELAFARLQTTPVFILGAGAVGSWAAVLLAKTGFQEFVLADDDIVERSNLNRSLYSHRDVGKSKCEALRDQIVGISTQIQATAVRTRVETAESLRVAMWQRKEAPQGIVVNAADWPTVDATSAIVDVVCQERRIPYVIAGGYNLHLSLIGMTVLPGQSACYHCGRITLDEKPSNQLGKLRKLSRPRRNVGNLGPLAAITASFAVNEVIRLAVRGPRVAPRMLNRRAEFNFLTNQLHSVDLPPRDECGCCPRPLGT